MSEPNEDWPTNEYFQGSAHPIKNLIFKGGSVKGIAYLGALLCLDKLGKLEELVNVAGTSAGAITALLIALGLTIQEVQDQLLQLDIERLLDDDTLIKLQSAAAARNSESRSVKGLLSVYRDLRDQFGVSKTDKIEKWLGNLIADKTWAIIHMIEGLGVDSSTDETAKRNIARNLTFGELNHLTKNFKGFKNLYVQAFNLKKQWSFNFNHEKYSDVIIVDAVVASLSIPFLFAPHKIFVRNLIEGQEGLGGNANKLVHPRFEKDYFVDGGIAQNYPIEKFRNVPGTVGFYLASPPEATFIILKGPQSQEEEPTGFLKYAKTVLETLLSYHQLREHVHHNDRRLTIYINTKNIGTFDFDLDETKKNVLIQSGWEAVRAAYANEADELELGLECPFQISVPPPPPPPPPPRLIETVD